MYQEGEVLAGKYRVEKLLGQGGMGVVVAARHLQLQERVAVKLMLTDDTNEEAVERFVREARAAARIESDHVAHVSDVGVLTDGRAYLVMEYLDGQDLSQLLESRGRLPAAEAVDYLLQACEAIAEAHSLGIVHRDLKPSNLFLTRRRDRTPHVKVLDFGISKMGTPSMAHIPITSTSALMGSPLYMSPEQMTSTKDVDARSDIWALGVVLYELLAALAPFDGESLPQVCARVMQEQPASLAAVVPGLPAGLAAIVNRCLEKRPDARYQSLAELALALAPFGTLDSFQSVERIQRLLGAPDFLLLAPDQSVLTSAPTRGPTAAPSAVSMMGTQTNWGDPQIPGLQRSKLPWLLSALAVVVLGGAGVFVKEARDQSRLSSAAPPPGRAVAEASSTSPGTTAAQVLVSEPASSAGTSSATVATPATATPSVAISLNAPTAKPVAKARPVQASTLESVPPPVLVSQPGVAVPPPVLVSAPPFNEAPVSNAPPAAVPRSRF